MANKKITQLDALTSAAAAEGDVLPIVDLDADQTKKIQLGDLKSGSFVGTSTGLAGKPSIEVSELSASADTILGGELFFMSLSGGGLPSTNQVLTRDATTGQIYITGSYANAGGGGGGSAFPFTGSAEITGSLKMIGPITSSGDISGSNSISTNRAFIDVYVESPLFQGELGTQLVSPAGTVGITGSSGIGIKTIDPSSGNIDVNSSQQLRFNSTNTTMFNSSEGFRITSSGGGINPIHIDSGTEDGIFMNAGANSFNLHSANNIILTGSEVRTLALNSFWVKQDGAHGIKITGSDLSSEGIHMYPGGEAPIFLQTALGQIKLQSSDDSIIQDAGGDFEITSSGTNGFKVSSSKFNIAGNGDSEIRVGAGAINIQGSDTGDVGINAGFARTLNLSSEGGDVNANGANVKIDDNAGQSTFHVSASGIHLNQEDQFYQIISNLPTTEPSVAGQLWASGSGPGTTSKYIMIKQ